MHIPGDIAGDDDKRSARDAVALWRPIHLSWSADDPPPPPQTSTFISHVSTAGPSLISLYIHHYVYTSTSGPSLDIWLIHVDVWRGGVGLVIFPNGQLPSSLTPGASALRGPPPRPPPGPGAAGQHREGRRLVRGPLHTDDIQNACLPVHSLPALTHPARQPLHTILSQQGGGCWPTTLAWRGAPTQPATPPCRR